MAQIYRVGKDIFDASTNQKIANPDILKTQYAGATEIKAPSIPTGATKILNPAGLQGLNESQIYRQGKDIYKLPSVISSDMITGGTAPTIKPVESSFTDTAPYVAGLDTTTKGLESLVSTALVPTPQEANISPITSKITELTGQFEQKPVDYQAELDKYGFKTNVQDLQNLNTQIASTKAQYDKIAEQNANLPISSRIIGGTQDRLARQSAIELGGLSSMAQALQGNVAMAQDIADKTIAIKYEPVEQEIANQKFQLEQVYSQLTRDEKKKADALKITLDERQRLIDEQKTKDADITKLMTAAAGQGATSDILQQMLKAKTTQEAVIIGRDYLREASKGNLQDLGNGQFYNPNTGTIQTINEIQQAQNIAQGIVTTATGDAYDIKSYATDPTHEAKIQSILNGIGKFNTVADIDNYIQSRYPNSPVTGQMIANSAGKYGVSWEMMTAIMAQDSSMGTAGKAVRTKNPGNVGNTDSGGTRTFGSWQEGVDAVAKNLSWRKTTSVATAPIISSTDQQAIDIFNGNGSISKVSTKDYPAVSKKLGELKAEALSSGDIEGIMRASAGGKDADATTVQSFEKAFNVIGQLSDLQSSVNKEATGPIIGIIRSNNPYDAKAKLIQAQLTALVPNLARGIYGEVGVLTDNDVKLYAQTLPNLKSTEEVQKLILASTVRSVQRSTENKIKVQAGLGRDVSGLVNQYKDIKSTADALEGGSVGQAPVSPTNITENPTATSYLDSVNKEFNLGNKVSDTLSNIPVVKNNVFVQLFNKLLSK